MNTQRARIAGFMSAESIYSLAFYIVMVAAIAGVGAGVLTNKDSAKAAAAVSLLRANFVAEAAGLGYTPTPVPTAAAIVRMSGNLMVLSAVPSAILPGGSGTVTMGVRGGVGAAAPVTGFTISIVGIEKPAICAAVAGVGYGTWTGLAIVSAAGALPGPTSSVSQATKSDLKTACDTATSAASKIVGLLYVSD